MNSHFLELLESSSLPGLSILIKSKQIIVKIVWFIFIVFLMSLSIKCVIETIKTYYEYQVVTNINVISEQTLPFPTVSFCMNSKIKPNISNLNNVLLSCNFGQSTWDQKSIYLSACSSDLKYLKTVLAHVLYLA